mgnify:CR=1 FL=1
MLGQGGKHRDDGDAKDRGLVLVHSVPRARKMAPGKGSAKGKVPAIPGVFRVSAVLERVERQLLHAFSKAPPHLTGRVVATDSADYFVEELLAKALVRGFRRIILRSSIDRCIYAYEDSRGLINAYTLQRAFYVKIATRLRALGNVDIATASPVNRGRFRIGFEHSPGWVEVGVVSRLGDYGEFVSCGFLWHSATVSPPSDVS